MSVISGLKNIDIQKHAVISILDAIEIDIDPDDGHLHYAEDPSISIDINDKILRVDIGDSIGGIKYTTFNPLIREDHAQFLMTLILHAQIFADRLTVDEVSAADFSITTEQDLLDECGGELVVPINTSIISNADESIQASGTHTEPAMATTFAVLAYAVKSKFITDAKRIELMNLAQAAYQEYTRLSELRPNERKTVLKERSGMLRPPEAPDTSEAFLDGLVNVTTTVETFDDDPDDDVELEDTDFQDDDEDFVDMDFADHELFEYFGHPVDPVVNASTSEDDEDEDDTDYSGDMYQMQSDIIVPVESSEDINFFDEDVISSIPSPTTVPQIEPYRNPMRDIRHPTNGPNMQDNRNIPEISFVSDNYEEVQDFSNVKTTLEMVREDIFGGTQQIHYSSSLDNEVFTE